MGTQPTESDYGKESEPVGERSTRDSDKRGGEQPGYYREQPGGLEGKEAEKSVKESNDYIQRTVNKWVDLYEKGKYEEIFDNDVFNNVYANRPIIKPFEERIGFTIPDISTEKAKKDFIESLKEKFVKPETDSLKKDQYEIIRQSNPIRDDIHTGIRSEADILTAEEAFTPSINENEDVTPDFTVSDMKEALKSGRITVYSSYPIENGVFVTPSKMEAQNYAGKNKVYSKKVPLSNVAWVDATEGQYAEIEREEEKIDYNEQIKQLRQEIDDLIRERDEKFPNPDIESPMSKEEKELNKRIADKFSEINRIIKNKRDEQREGSKEAFELETEAIESASKAVEYKSKNVGSDKQSAGEVKEESDELIEQVEDQLQKIDLRLQDLQMTGRIYLTGGIYTDYPINVLAKGVIKKDATKFVDAVKKLTGLQYDTNKKGKTEKVSVDIAPAGGDISFFLWSNVDPELGVYVSIPVEGSVEYDEYSVPKEGNILWRLTTKKNKYTGLENQWVKADITAGELSKIILNELNRKLAEEGKPEEKPEDVTSNKVNEKTKITSPKKKKAGASGQKQLLDIKPGKPEPQPFDIVQKAKEVVKKDQERRSPEKKKKTLSDYPLANKFITDWQKPAVRDMWESHESIVENIEKTLESIPRNPKDNGMKSTVYAHYFMGATDIFVMDVEGDNIYAYVILNGDSQMSEAGSMSLSYITGIMGMELDFFWTPKPLDEALYNADREYFPNPKEVEKEISGEKTTEIKEKALSLTENKSEVEPEKEEQNERERTEEQDGRRDNSRAGSGRKILPESKQVGGQGTPATDTTGHSQSKRGNIEIGGSQSGAGFKYDLSKSYSNEEIHQIVSSVTDMIFIPSSC